MRMLLAGKRLSELRIRLRAQGVVFVLISGLSNQARISIRSNCMPLDWRWRAANELNELNWLINSLLRPQCQDRISAAQSFRMCHFEIQSARGLISVAFCSLCDVQNECSCLLWLAWLLFESFLEQASQVDRSCYVVRKASISALLRASQARVPTPSALGSWIQQ